MLWLCLFVSSFAFGQTTFSSRVPIVTATVFNSVQVLSENKYLVTGATYDTIPNVHVDAISALFDAFGNFVSSQQFGDSLHQTITQHHTSSSIPNYYIQQGYGNRNGKPAALYFWFNENGDTLQSATLQSPFVNETYFGSTYINPLYTIIVSDSTIYATTGVFQEGTSNDVCIWHLDKYGNELWHYIYATEADPETCYAMIPWQGGVMAAIFKGINDSAFQSDLVLVHLNSNGTENQIISENLWNNNSFGLRAMILEANAIICAGSICEATNLTSRCSLWKLNDSGDLVWSSPIGDYPESTNAYNSFQNIVKVTDGNYVGTSEHYYYEYDSHFDVRVIKCDSTDGSMMWERYYHFVESQSDMHHAIDLKATPDGGVVFCGDASDTWSQNPNLELPAQQGWIVKLDACGCLVPGCDEGCTVGVEDAGGHPELDSGSLFIMGPNPARAYINIYLNKISNVQHSSLNIQVHDLAGNIVKSFAPHRGDTTYIVDTTGLAAGQYVVSLVSEGAVLQSEKIVVAR